MITLSSTRFTWSASTSTWGASGASSTRTFSRSSGACVYGESASSTSAFGSTRSGRIGGSREKRENSPISSLRSRTAPRIMSIAEGKMSAKRAGSRPQAVLSVSAARPTGVSGFLISWMTRSTASFQAVRRWVARIWVRSSTTTTVPTARWPSPWRAEAATERVRRPCGRSQTTWASCQASRPSRTGATASTRRAVSVPPSASSRVRPRVVSGARPRISPARSLNVSIRPLSSSDRTPVPTFAMTVARWFLRARRLACDARSSPVRASTIPSRLRL